LNNDDLGAAQALPGPGDTSPAENPASARKPVGRVRWYIHLILIGGYFLPVLFFNGPRHHPVLRDTSRDLILVCAIDFLLFAAMFGLAWLASRATREQMFLVWRPRWLVIPLGLAYSVAIRLAIAIIAIAVSIVLLTTVFDQQQLRDFWQSKQPDVSTLFSISAARSNPVYAWLLITLVSFISAGLREELWRAGTLAGLRALWPKAFGSRTGEVVAILLIAVAFGAGHLRMGVLAAIVAGILGVMLGLIMIIHRSVWPAVVAHGCFDAFTFALIAWMPSDLQHFQ
jgi:membrane protease YdiL (CAAX protease family)